MYFVHLNFKQRSNRIIKYYRDQDQLIQNKVLKENLHQPAVCERELKLFSKLFLNVKVMFSPGSPFSRYRRNSFDMRRTNIYNSSKTSSKYFSSIDFFSSWPSRSFSVSEYSVKHISQYPVFR